MKKFFIFSIIFIAFAIRLYHARDFFFWQSDEDIIALTVKKILINHDLQFVGFPVPGGFYLGPLIFYILSFFYAIAGMDPLKLPYISAAIGAITTFCIYKVGKTIFEKESIGIISAIVFAFSYLAQVYSRILTGLTFAPILTLFVYFFLYKNLKSGGGKYVLPITATLIVASQNEGSSLSLIILTITVWLYGHLKIKRSDLVKSVSLFFAAQLPLLIFELKHNFSLTRSALAFLTRSSPVVQNNFHGSPVFRLSFITSAIEVFPQVIARFLFVAGPKNIGGQILPCEDLVRMRLLGISPVAFILAISIFGFFVFRQIIKRKKADGEKIVAIHLLIMLFGLIIYNIFQPNYFFEWVTVVFFPGLVFMIAYFFDFLYRNLVSRFLVFIFLGIFVLYNVRFLFRTNSEFGLQSKMTAVKFALSKTEGRPFYLDSIGSCNALGYEYLFWQQGQLPALSLGIGYQLTPTLIPTPVGPTPNLGVVIVNKANVESENFFETYKSYRQFSKDSSVENGIEIMIIEGKKL